jgi:hypothetical protein
MFPRFGTAYRPLRGARYALIFTVVEDAGRGDPGFKTIGNPRNVG